MKTPNFIQKYILFTTLTFGSLLSVQAAVPIDDNNCGAILPADTTYELVGNMNCNDNEGSVALTLTGNSKLLLKGFTISADALAPPQTGIMITNDDNLVAGPGSVEGFDDEGIIIHEANNNHVNRVKIVGGFVIGIFLFNANRNTLHDNIIEKTVVQGIALDNSNMNIISHNLIEVSMGNAKGIALDQASNNLVHDNKIIGGGWYIT